MSGEKPTFDAKILLANKPNLKKRNKNESPKQIANVEEKAAELGFPSRTHTPKKGRGRPKSKFTSQFHAMLLPDDFEFIRAKASESGKQYGAVIAEALNALRLNGKQP